MATSKSKNSWVQKLLNKAKSAKDKVSDTVEGAKETVDAYKNAYDYKKQTNKAIDAYTKKKAKEHSVDMKDGLKKTASEYLDASYMKSLLKDGKVSEYKKRNKSMQEALKKKGY